MPASDDALEAAFEALEIDDERQHCEGCQGVACNPGG